MTDYPVSFAVDYPDRELDRLSSFFRIFAVIPIAIVLATIVGFSSSYDGVDDTTRPMAVGGVGCTISSAVRRRWSPARR